MAIKKVYFSQGTNNFSILQKIDLKWNNVGDLAVFIYEITMTDPYFSYLL